MSLLFSLSPWVERKRKLKPPSSRFPAKKVEKGTKFEYFMLVFPCGDIFWGCLQVDAQKDAAFFIWEREGLLLHAPLVSSSLSFSARAV